MKKFSIVLFACAALLVAASSALAHEKVKLTGYVVDTVCFADKANAKPEEAAKEAAGHTKDCALMEDCIKGGYGVYAEGKWYPFDAKGNDLAKAVFSKTGKKDHIKMTIEGMKHDGKILVEKITEAE